MKLSQGAVAKALGTATSSSQYYERDERPFPVELFGRLHAQLGVMPTWVLNGSGEIWRDRASTPEHLRAPEPPPRDEAVALQRARDRVMPMLEDYPAIKGHKVIETALLNVAMVDGIEQDHLYLLGNAFNVVLVRAAQDRGDVA